MIAVIGGGPAGMMAAYSLAQNGISVDLFEQNEKLGKKLFITGKGRCNVTNATDIENFFDNIPRNNKFLYSALYTFTNENLMNLLESTGCKLKVERGNRVFPKSDKSSDIIKAFEKLIKNDLININLNTKVSGLVINDNICQGIVVNGKKKLYDAVVLCTGGFSYQSTGSDGSGYEMAKEAGHTITSIEPSLVGITTKEDWPREVSGLTLRNVTLTLYKGKKQIFKELGECLFTHTGISGPIVLSASSFLKKPYDDYKIVLDLKPALTLEKLDDRINRDFKKNLNKDFVNSLNELLPKNLIPIIIKLSGIDPRTKVNQITKEQRLKLGEVIKNLTFTIQETNSINTAIITRGGVDIKEINPQTMESTIIKNLYFAGEVIDVDALTGGFNIQIACSTGYLAGLGAYENNN